MKRLVLPLFVLLLLSLVSFAWYKEGILPPNSSDKKPIIFVVERGESVSSISRKLENEKLIRNRLVFFLLVKLKGIEKKIQAGDYRLYRNLNAAEIADSLTHGTLDIWVTIIEGMRSEEIAVLLAKNFDIPETVFLNLAKPQEGYLFPDTYLIPRGANSQMVVKIMRQNFDSKVTPEIVSGIEKHNLTLSEGVILASLLEREAQSYEDKRMVAGILLNRLRIDMPLQVDATVQYVLGYSNTERNWWRKQLTAQDLKIDSEFNTYKYPGLPPRAIANPGLESIRAVSEAQDNDYLYYLTDNNGVMHYARSLDGHNKNIAHYLN